MLSPDPLAWAVSLFRARPVQNSRLQLTVSIKAGPFSTTGSRILYITFKYNSEPWTAANGSPSTKSPIYNKELEIFCLIFYFSHTFQGGHAESQASLLNTHTYHSDPEEMPEKPRCPRFRKHKLY